LKLTKKISAIYVILLLFEILLVIIGADEFTSNQNSDESVSLDLRIINEDRTFDIETLKEYN